MGYEFERLIKRATILLDHFHYQCLWIVHQAKKREWKVNELKRKHIVLGTKALLIQEYKEPESG